ncbi:MAG: OPT/YSL family transporter [Candidatus Riflebacteria bacterium]|nr:OPT/YSL family transporter [Candidatus Riflebacteria bacterium]
MTDSRSEKTGDKTSSDSIKEKKLTPEEIELNWYNNVYQGDNQPQLTLRAIVMGSVLGGFMSLSNLYVGLKTGWGLGVAITACILSFAIHKSMMAIFPRWFPTEMSLLENNCMQSTASSAGYSTGGTMTSAIAAYLIVTQVHMPWYILATWTFFLAALGVFMAIPMKRQMINIEQLKFPSGIAAAETLRSLHSEGGDAVDKARSLGIAGLFGGVIAWLRDAGIPKALAIPGSLPFPGRLFGIPLTHWTINLEMSAIMIAAGAIMGWKIAWSLLFGATINYAVIAPWMVQYGAIEAVNTHADVIIPAFLGSWTHTIATIDPIMSALNSLFDSATEPFIAIGSILHLDSVTLRPLINNTIIPLMQSFGGESVIKLGFKQIVSWSTWTGASIMVSSGLLSFMFQWRTVVRAFSGLADIFKPKGKKNSTKEDPLERIEVPPSWFAGGMLFSGIGCIGVLYFAFKTSFIMGIVAVASSFLLSVVACRATGESDITPVGAMGKITQLVFGVLAPSNIVTNLMTASITAGAAGSSADLLTDLKSGYLLGANPRKQFLAQFAGIFAGVIVVVPAFYLLVPTADVLGGDKWPAPSAQVWAAVAKLLANGLNALHITARMGILVGCLVGIALTLVEAFLPTKIKRFIPSAMGIGLSMVLPFFNSLSMFIGALISMTLEKIDQPFAEKYIVPVSSGIIAGESLLGVAIALLDASGGLAWLSNVIPI